MAHINDPKKGPLTSPWISKVRGAVGNKRSRMAELPAGVRPRKLPLQAAQREQREQLEHSDGPKASFLSWSGREDPSRQWHNWHSVHASNLCVIYPSNEMIQVFFFELRHITCSNSLCLQSTPKSHGFENQCSHMFPWKSPLIGICSNHFWTPDFRQWPSKAWPTSFLSPVGQRRQRWQRKAG